MRKKGRRAAGFSWPGGGTFSRGPGEVRLKLRRMQCLPFAMSTGQRMAEKEGCDMATGTVKWFNDEKGFGFITPDEGDRDLFVHYSGIEGNGFRSLEENAKVSYDEEAGDKGPKAVNVRKI
jgi:cold shock protein